VTFRFEPERLRDAMFQVPGSATDNGLTADGWTLLADLDADEAPGVLDAMAEASVAGYTVAARGKEALTGRKQLFVDSKQYSRGEQVLMDFLRGRTTPPAGAPTRTSAPRPPRQRPAAFTAVARVAAIRPVRWTFQIVVGAALIAGALWIAYKEGPSTHPGVHPLQQTVSPAAPQP
jgi:hypothetical protein